MTADEKFLKAARIEPCKIDARTWMTWRDEEVDTLRMAVANWINQAREECRRADRWKLIAFAGWAVALMFFYLAVTK